MKTKEKNFSIYGWLNNFENKQPDIVSTAQHCTISSGAHENVKKGKAESQCPIVSGFVGLVENIAKNSATVTGKSFSLNEKS